MSDALKPCPFCGGANVEVFGPIGWTRRFGISHSCHTFYGGSGDFTIGGVTKDQAIAQWNRRADLPPTPEQIMADPRVKALVEALCDLINQTHDCEKELTEMLHKRDFCGESLPLVKARTAIAQLKEPKT